jgi:dTDP-4-dehydrorhamnose reductase
LQIATTILSSNPNKIKTLIATKNILVTGANGQLGMEFRELAPRYSGFRFLFAAKEELSITDQASVDAYFSKHSIHFCINCAAYTAVDKAETDKAEAILVNETAVANLAATCQKYGSVFFHFSTDYVFDGTGSRPYQETDTTSPVNFYGETKLRGELAALQNNPQSVIIRTSWVYSRFGKNFVKTMMRLMSEKAEIGVVADQFGSPTYARELAVAVMQIIEGDSITPGVYHYCNEGVISWHQFALAIKELALSNCKVNGIETKAYPTPAARPHYSALDCKKISENFGLKLNPWKDSLKQCIAEM